MKNQGYCNITANLLQSKKNSFLKDIKNDIQDPKIGAYVWCQERDSNPRPPAYEDGHYTLDIFRGILSEKYNNNLKVLYTSVLSKIKHSNQIKLKEIVTSLHRENSSFYRLYTYFYCKLYCKLFINNFNHNILYTLFNGSLFVLMAQKLLSQTNTEF